VANAIAHAACFLRHKGSFRQGAFENAGAAERPDLRPAHCGYRSGSPEQDTFIVEEKREGLGDGVQLLRLVGRNRQPDRGHAP
jgi:hypothetical protein